MQGENVAKFEKTNVQSELLFCGCMYKEPDLYLSYGESIKSKYDFSDEPVRFFYDLFEEYYLTFSQDVSQNKMNNFNLTLALSCKERGLEPSPQKVQFGNFEDNK